MFSEFCLRVLKRGFYSFIEAPPFCIAIEPVRTVSFIPYGRKSSSNVFIRGTLSDNSSVIVFTVISEIFAFAISASEISSALCDGWQATFISTSSLDKKLLRRQMTYFYNVYQLVELFFNLLQGICRSVCDNCDTGDFLVLCNAYRKAVYIETPVLRKVPQLLRERLRGFLQVLI